MSVVESWQSVQARRGFPGFHRRQSAAEVVIPWSDAAFAWLVANRQMARFYVSRLPPVGDPRQPRPISIRTDDYAFAEEVEARLGGQP